MPQSIQQLRERCAGTNSGRAHCGQRGCAVAGAIHNVKGQLALESGRLDLAAASAKAALSASRSSGDRAEAANALRLLGITAIRTGDAGAATGYLDEALAVDRELAAPRKVYLDLIGLGRASALRGDRGAARSFYERAKRSATHCRLVNRRYPDFHAGQAEPQAHSQAGGPPPRP